MKHLLIILLISLSAPSFAVETIPPAKLSKGALYEVLASNMACLCGCGTTLKTCPHETCTFAIPVRKELRGLIDQGLAVEEIKAKMVAHHGEAILAQPTFYGFNTLAWITPFVAIMAVGYLVTLLVKKWSSAKTATAAPKPAATSQPSDPYLEKMREELRRFEDR